MIKKIFFTAKMVCLLGAVVLAFPALAAWSDVPAGVSPTVCPSGTPGCNTPLNVSNLSQTKSGVLNLGGLSTGFGAPNLSYQPVTVNSLPIGVYSYRYTLVVNGLEVVGSAPSSINVLANALNVKVTLPYGPVTLPAGATGVKIYRQLNAGVWNLLNVGNLSIDTTGLYYFIHSNLHTVNTAISYPTSEMNTTVNNNLYYKNGTQGLNKVLTSDANGLATWQTPATTGTSLWTASTDGLNVYRSSGNVGIGTTLPSQKLSVSTSVSNNGTNINTAFFKSTAGHATVLIDSASSGYASELGFGYGDVRKWHIGRNYLNNFNITESGVAARLTILNTSGNVGMGTVLPLEKLHVYSANNAYVRLESAVNQSSGFQMYEDVSGIPYGFSFFYDGGSNDNNFLIQSKAGTLLTTRLTIQRDSGNVGIGKTPDVGTKLDVAGKVKATSLQIGSNSVQGQVLTAVDASGNAVWATPAPATATANLWTANSAGNIYRSTGNVGIGTANNPLYQLVISEPYTSSLQTNFYGTGAKLSGQMARLYLEDTGSAANEKLIGLSNTAGITSFASFNDFGSAVIKSNILTMVHSTGNVGIGIASPSSALDVAGTIEVASGSANIPSYAFGADTNTGMYSGGSDILKFATAGVDSVVISSSGNVGIGTTAPSANLDVAGSLKTSTLQVTTGAGVAGKVLTSDGLGNATWQAPATSGTTPTTPTFTNYRCKAYSISGVWWKECSNTTNEFNVTYFPPSQNTIFKVEADNTFNSYFSFEIKNLPTDYWSSGKFTCPSGTILMSANVACGDNDGTAKYKNGSGAILHNNSRETIAVCDSQDKRSMMLSVVCGSF